MIIINNNTDLIIEYSKYLYDRICSKLFQTYKDELLCFVLCKIHLGLKQLTIQKIKWEQIDFENMIIKNVVCSKFNRNIGNVNLDEKLKEQLLRWFNNREDKINVFPNIKSYLYLDKIKEVTGIFNLSSHDLRRMSLYLNLMNQN